MSGTHGSAVASPFKQPKAVFAVAFACVVSFMGIGLVDPVASAAYSFVRFIGRRPGAVRGRPPGHR
jgi:hypothetical protein